MDYDAVGGILGIEDTYQSNFDYKSFQVEPETIDKLIRFEQDIKNHQKKTLDSIFSMSKILYNARTLLANNKSGTFGAWHESLGLNREAVSVMLKRYDLYLQTKDKTVMELPVRAVKVITKAESKFSKDQIKEIISADKPLSKIQDIVRQSDNINSENHIEEAELIEEIVDMEIITKDFTTIKKLLAKAETKLSTEATKTQREKLLRIQEILRDL
jgi:phage FluMu protein gp41